MVKTQFNIKDLENLSGVKAHTIRIWEKRYNLLSPERTDTNIRKYNLENLKKLLNVSFLYNEGYKISKIAKLKNEEIKGLVNSLANSSEEQYAIKMFKMAMFEFNFEMFSDTYSELLKKKSFDELFIEVLIPLLNEIGRLWQTETIDPCHERFISELIKQKVIVNIELEQAKKSKLNDKVVVLFLPLGEIHEIGLLFANYLILKAGYKSIYLGTNIPLNNLQNVLKHYDNITFLSYFTIQPDKESILSYVRRFQKLIGIDKAQEFWLMGNMVKNIDHKKLPNNILVINGHRDLKQKLNS